MPAQKTRNRNDHASSHHRSNSQRSHRYYPLPLPEVVTIDVIGTMLDEDLAVRLRLMEEQRGSVLDANGDPRPWEEEVAYLRREQQLRRGRRENHSEWLRKEQAWFESYEASLPAGDFDNSAYVYAATGGRPRWS